MREATKVWLEYAGQDLKAASLILQDPSLTSMVAFHSQQAIEKSLKALLEENEEEVPRTHDLARLYALNRVRWKLDLDEDTLRLLGTLYIDTRYPSEVGLLPSGRPTEVEAEKFVRFAREVNDKVNILLKGRNK